MCTLLTTALVGLGRNDVAIPISQHIPKDLIDVGLHLTLLFSSTMNDMPVDCPFVLHYS